MIVKIHSSEGKKLVAIADSNLIGMKFEEKNRQLDLSGDFYKGEEKTQEEIENIIHGAYMLNIIGSISIEFAIKRGWIDKGQIIKIKDIPHAQVLLMGE